MFLTGPHTFIILDLEMSAFVPIQFQFDLVQILSYTSWILVYEK